MDVAIRQPALEELHDGPAIRHRLQLVRRAQVAEEAAAFLDAAQRKDRREQRALVLLLLPLRHRAVGLHGCFHAAPMY